MSIKKKTIFTKLTDYKMILYIFPKGDNYSEIFYSCQFIKSFRSFHSFWEEDDLSSEINTSFSEWHRYHIMTIQFQGHPASSAVAYLKNFYVYENFQRLSVMKVPNQYRIPMTSSHKIQAKTITWPNMHFMLDRLHSCAKQRNRNKRAPRWVVIYIRVHLVLIYP